MSQLLTAVEEELRGVDTEEGQEGLAEPEEATFGAGPVLLPEKRSTSSQKFLIS